VTPAERLLPDLAESYFRAERISARAARGDLAPGFAVLVTLEGQATVCSERGERVPVAGGDTVLVPHAAGATVIEGDATIIRCRPPAPDVGAGRW
jgi:mannose-6-phosphate isomerase